MRVSQCMWVCVCVCLWVHDKQRHLEPSRLTAQTWDRFNIFMAPAQDTWLCRARCKRARSFAQICSQVPRNRFAGLITATSCRRCRWQRRYADVRVFTHIFRDVLTHTHTLTVGARCAGLCHQSVVGHAFTACAVYLLCPVGGKRERERHTHNACPRTRSNPLSVLITSTACYCLSSCIPCSQGM